MRPRAVSCVEMNSHEMESSERSQVFIRKKTVRANRVLPFCLNHFFFCLVFFSIYLLAASGLSCGMRDPGCHVGSFIVVHEFSSCVVRTQQLCCMDSPVVV